MDVAGSKNRLAGFLILGSNKPLQFRDGVADLGPCFAGGHVVRVPEVESPQRGARLGAVPVFLDQKIGNPVSAAPGHIGAWSLME
jgi:hypothetical protein